MKYLFSRAVFALRMGVYLLGCISIMWSMQSCNMATMVHFNKDYSGDYQVDIDLSDMISMAAMFDEDAAGTKIIDTIRAMIDSFGLIEGYESIKGIHNVNVVVSDAGAIMISYHFDNVEALNNSFSELGEYMKEQAAGMMGGAVDMTDDTNPLGDQSFVRAGKTITHTTSMGSSGMLDALPEDESGMADMFVEMVDYTLDFTFDRKVKSVEVDGVNVLSQGKKDIKTRIDFARLMESGEYRIAIRLK